MVVHGWVPEVSIDILSLDVDYQTVCVSIQQVDLITISLLEDIIVECIHVELGQVKDRDTNRHGLVELDLLLSAFHTHHEGIDDSCALYSAFATIFSYL